MLEKGSVVRIMRPESYWFQECGTVATVAKSADRYPVVVRFEKVNYAGACATLLEEPAQPAFFFISTSLHQPNRFFSVRVSTLALTTLPLSLSLLSASSHCVPLPPSSFCAGVATNNFALDELVEVSAPPAKKAKAKAKAE